MVMRGTVGWAKAAPAFEVDPSVRSAFAHAVRWRNCVTAARWDGVGKGGETLAPTLHCPGRLYPP
jgi:hypothetical protein